MKSERYSEDEALDEAQRLKNRTGTENPSALNLDAAQKVIDKENVDNRPETQNEKWGRYDSTKAQEVWGKMLMVIDNTGYMDPPGGMKQTDVWSLGDKFEILEYVETFVEDDKYWSAMQDKIKSESGVEFDKEELRSEMRNMIIGMRSLKSQDTV